VIADHAAEPGRALSVKAGEVLKFERRPTEWKGWIWCTGRDGLGGWVPERWVSIEGDTCLMLRDYTSLELTVREGDIVSVKETESGWVVAVTSGGETGWVPLRCLEKPAHAAPPEQ
jgi:hypothetical protein